MNEDKIFLSLKNLNVGYDGHTLIHDICSDIHKGEIVTLIGPNGAGKSTILKSITRQLSIISGQVVLGNDDIITMPYRLLATRMSVVLTEHLKAELMTCYDLVATGRYPYTGRLGLLTDKDREIIEEALEQVHIKELADKDFNAISDGQKQRVLLARAICQEPEIIILDEPTSYLDVHHKLSLLSILRRMAKEKNITVVMSLHEIDLAQKISDKIICVKGDHLFAYGRPEDIFIKDSIRELYDIDNGSFDPLYGSIELPAPKGDPEVMILSTSGNGIPLYRLFQKAEIPFHAGILYENDLDHHLARDLAAGIISVKPFMPISENDLDQARNVMSTVKAVINAGMDIGSINAPMEELLKDAEDKGILMDIESYLKKRREQ
ncbi:MAG: ABC transporter ATP-binding protein [Lachnospiraceae bacterium]|nr:ABC transporter ATP-binding protein [Candidatus Equihabitans merdae]